MKKKYATKSFQEILESVLEEEKVILPEGEFPFKKKDDEDDDKKDDKEEDSDEDEDKKDDKKDMKEGKDKEDMEDTELDEEDCDDDEDEDKKDKEDMEESVKVHVSAIKNLFKDQELSEETVSKLGTIFTAAVTSLVSEKVKSAGAKINEKLTKEYETELVRAVSEIDEKIDRYISHAADEYINENKIAIESGIKTELVESFMSGMKKLFSEHYVEIPEEKVEIISEMASRLEEAQAKINILIEENITSKKTINSFKKVRVIAEMTSSLADTDKEKVAKLCEGVEYVNEEQFKEGVKTISENYLFDSKETEQPVIVNAEKTPMDAYLKALGGKGFTN
jgi:hypothetical protein